MAEQNEFKAGTSFVIDPIKGIAVPEEQYLAEQAAASSTNSNLQTLEEPE